MSSPESPVPTPEQSPPTPEKESDPLSTGEHQALGSSGRRDLIQAFDRLVAPLERILSHMHEHSRRQKRIEILWAMAVVVLIVATVYQVRLTNKMNAMERGLAAVSDVAVSTESKVSATEKKVDEVKVAASSAASAVASVAASQSVLSQQLK